MCHPFSGFIHRSLGVLRDPDPYLHSHSLMRIPVPTGKTTGEDRVSAIAFEAIPRFDAGQTYLTDPGRWIIHVDNPPAGEKFPDWIADLVIPSTYPGSSKLFLVDCPIVNAIVRAASAWAPTARSCDDTTVWDRDMCSRSPDSSVATSSLTFFPDSLYAEAIRSERHNTNGPAVVVQNYATKNITYVEYYKNGELHRTDGPAVIGLENDFVSYFVDGEHIHTAVAEHVIAEGGDLANIPDTPLIRSLEKTNDFLHSRSAADHLSDCDFSGVPILSPTYS